MERKARVDVYVEQYAHIVSHLSDFDGDTQKWKNAVYDLFRWNMTYSYAYKINVNESRSRGVFVCIYCRPKFEEPLLDTMEDLGFRNTKATHEDFGTIECTEFPEDMLLDFVVVDY